MRGRERRRRLHPCVLPGRWLQPEPDANDLTHCTLSTPSTPSPTLIIAIIDTHSMLKTGHGNNVTISFNSTTHSIGPIFVILCVGRLCFTYWMIYCAFILMVSIATLFAEAMVWELSEVIDDNKIKFGYVCMICFFFWYN